MQLVVDLLSTRMMLAKRIEMFRYVYAVGEHKALNG